MPVEMTPIEDAAADVIVVGDPRRAFALAQELTLQPRMSHLARGLWGYRGSTSAGHELTVQSTGVGGPAAVPVIGDLAAQGARRVLRLGTCTALDPELEAGTLVLVERAFALDGASRQLGEGRDFIRPDAGLFEAMDGLGQTGAIASHDLVERYAPAAGSRPDPEGTIARDLQTATTFALCSRLGVAAAALLIVSRDRSGRKLEEEELAGRFGPIGEAVLERLGSGGGRP